MGYRYGRRKELQVADLLTRNGWDCAVAKGSRGAVDVVAVRGQARAAIQVKATRADSISTSRLAPREQTRLIRAAANLGARPVLALTAGNRVWFDTVPEGPTLATRKLKPLRRDHGRR